ncbi:hypothetical protein BX600DRAFT_517692 [Xylariales sp. PMI_506]|nr:hypothetical protein BX600DRAFT_517692 [Xylariales sp. PMI_506]
MQFKTIILAATTASFTEALRFTNPNFNNITLGVPFNITWADAAGPVTLTLLLGGTPTYFKSMGTIASGLNDGYYLWTPGSSLLSNTYDIKFEDGTNTCYSFQFDLLGAPVTSTSTSTVTAAAKTTTYLSTWIWPPSPTS